MWQYGDIYPDSPNDEPTYTCVLGKVEWKTVQAYDTDEAGVSLQAPS